MLLPASSHWHSILHESKLEISVILSALLFTASGGRWIVNDPNSHFHQPLEQSKSETWTWQPQPLHHVIKLVLSATLNSSIKNLKDLPPILSYRNCIIHAPIHLSINWALWSLSFKFLGKQHISQGLIIKTLTQFILGIKYHWFQGACGIWLTAVNTSHEVLFHKASGKPLYSYLT